jgi:hypothetical protein
VGSVDWDVTTPITITARMHEGKKPVYGVQEAEVLSESFYDVI